MTDHRALAERTRCERKTALYRHFDHDGALLYVGISLSAVARLRQHMDVSHWSNEISRVDVQWFGTRAEAMDAERRAVQDEAPVHNMRLRKRKRSPVQDDNGSHADKAHRELCRSVAFDPLYTLDGAARALGLSKRYLRREIDARRLGCVQRTSSSSKKADPLISGWQIIDYIELLEAESAGVTA